jgi:preprotein translocase subunit SecG
MVIALTILHVFMCFAIIAIVLLQSGKGADIGSAFGGAGSQAVFGSMGTPTILGKLTTGVAVIFMITSFSLAMMGHHRSTTIMPATAPSAAPTAPAPAAPAAPAPATPAPAAPGQK